MASKENLNYSSSIKEQEQKRTYKPKDDNKDAQLYSENDRRKSKMADHQKKYEPVNHEMDEDDQDEE